MLPLSDVFTYNNVVGLNNQSTIIYADLNLNLNSYAGITYNPIICFNIKSGYAGTRINFCSLIGTCSGETILSGNNANGNGTV